jgi:eukaryotic-like serine/threonine-protein kinase
VTAKPSLAVGDLFARRYRVTRLLGRGGMGAVYAVFDQQLEEHVALKLLTMPHPAALARFQREVRLARRVTHPAVARTHDIGTFGDLHFLTMELVEGESLKQRLKKEDALTVDETVRIGSALCAGLASAHEAGVLHRDLKPANIMLGNDGRVVITDFGIARPAEAAMDGIETVGFIGTPRYMAPEVIEGAAFDERADLYALGLVLYEMLAGKRYRLSELGDDDPTRANTRMGADEQPALEHLVRRLLSLAPEGRPASAKEAWAELTSGSHETLPSNSREASTRVVPAMTPPLPQGKRLAVAPFRGRGSEEANELAEVLSEELVDLLSRNSGIQVLAHRASSTLTDADVTSAGRALGADWMVSGTVTRRGSRVRISVRLVEVANGAQLYSERFDSEVTDVFDLEDRIAMQIGEALRMEVALVARRGSADAEAIEHYLRGRRKLRSYQSPPGAGLPDFEAALERAPDFGVAIAAHAISAVRRWWRLGLSGEDEATRNAVEQSVQRALTAAPDIAETHLAAAMWATHMGDYRASAEALRRALDIAPTCAPALDYLGQLECEAGRSESGSKRIALAYSLDPTIVAGQVWMVRWHALFGRVDDAIARLDELDARLGGATINRLQVRMRIAAWRGDRDMLLWCRDQLSTVYIDGVEKLVSYIDVVMNDSAARASMRQTLSLASESYNQRFATFALQLGAEAFGVIGEVEQTRECVTRASEVALADLDWLERCPPLEGLRDTPAYEDIRKRVRVRARRIWQW